MMSVDTACGIHTRIGLCCQPGQAPVEPNWFAGHSALQHGDTMLTKTAVAVQHAMDSAVSAVAPAVAFSADLYRCGSACTACTACTDRQREPICAYREACTDIRATSGIWRERPDVLGCISVCQSFVQAVQATTSGRAASVELLRCSGQPFYSRGHAYKAMQSVWNFCGALANHCNAEAMHKRPCRGGLRRVGEVVHL